jgi:hypothetical protein
MKLDFRGLPASASLAAVFAAAGKAASQISKKNTDLPVMRLDPYFRLEQTTTGCYINAAMFLIT